MTTLKKGGVLQRAVSFVSHLDASFGDYQWHILLSEIVATELKRTGVDLRHPSEVFAVSPARSLEYRRRICNAVNAQNADMLFTFAGPSYISPRCPELMGVADGWVTHATPAAFKSIPHRRDRWTLRIASKYKLHWFKTADQYTVQTETARQGLSRRGKVSLNRIHIVPNALAKWYRTANFRPTDRSTDQPIQILYFAAAYSHKRHDLLPDVCHRLRALGIDNFCIRVTLPQESQIWKDVAAAAVELGVQERIVNIGPVPVDQGANLYRDSHICFVPSILETFSATYLEAMATRTPIVACDLDFAREICGDSAVYFEPSSANDAAQKIFDLLGSPSRMKRQQDAGVQRLAMLPGVERQMEIYRETFDRFLNSCRST
tara:strand:+ start:249596 stop:250723 length:1128 start_codon:yes stop_codon:yes gene_type:complete